MDGVFLNGALEAFSDYMALDELYEGPYCVLSAVDNRQFKRIAYEVLDHDPSHEDIVPFLRQLKRGRASSKDKKARRLARQSKSIQEKVSDLFQDRLLFVKRRLKPSERKRLLFITRGLPQLRKLREIMDHIYALFDRRCRTQTALNKLKKLRQWVKRFKWIGETLNKVFSANLEKALTFLDDKLLPATSNAVERGNRRYRKMQKSVYRVRHQACLEGRIALDMIRESRAEGRARTTKALHKARRGYT
jgi:hypothetical protein